MVLLLEEDLRFELKKPLGKLFSSFEDAIDEIKSAKFLISVGDVTTANLIKYDLYPNISIIDNLIQRKNHEHEFIHTNNILKAKNPPGTITSDLWETIELAIENAIDGENQLIIVEGEEDLAVLPCVLIAPEKSVILYGQPNEGLVFVNVIDVKNKANELIKMFKKV